MQQNEILSNNGKKLTPGMVTVGGSKKQYTKSTTNPDTFKSQYIDAMIVAEGEDKSFTYSEPKIERK